jgi:hypothetical protein
MVKITERQLKRLVSETVSEVKREKLRKEARILRKKARMLENSGELYRLSKRDEMGDAGGMDDSGEKEFLIRIKNVTDGGPEESRTVFAYSMEEACQKCMSDSVSDDFDTDMDYSMDDDFPEDLPEARRRRARMLEARRRRARMLEAKRRRARARKAR